MTVKKVCLDWNIFKGILTNVELARKNLDLQTIDNY